MMRNFLHIGSVDPLPLLHQIANHPALWNADPLRKQYPNSPHHAVDDILLRFQPSDLPIDEIIDGLECKSRIAWHLLPEAQNIVMQLMARVGGVRLGRVIVTRLPCGGRIDAHSDGGESAAYYNRYHVCLQSDAGNVTRCGGEQVGMSSGSVWLFDNQLDHEVLNNSAQDRIVMIVDIAVNK